MKTYDVIILGLGGMGSAALYAAAKRGLRVLGIEQFGLAHDRGSSHGATRIIRRAYFEHPDYVPLVDRSYEHWEQLERESGQRLLTRCGLLLFGPENGPIISGVRRAAEMHRMNIEEVSPADAAMRFPGFRPTSDMVALLETDAGYLHVEDCVSTYIEQAQVHGAKVQFNTPVIQWSADPSGVTVPTNDGDFHAERLILCAGPWTKQITSNLNLPLEVRRKIVLWLRAHDDTYDQQRGCPIFGFDAPEGFFYGFPQIDARGVKVGDHSGGDVLLSADDVQRNLIPGDSDRILKFARQFMPQLSNEISAHSICLYTMTPDEHFIVDRHPKHPNVSFAAGFSGHGFKFAPVIGQALVDLACASQTDLPIGFLHMHRPALRPPQ